MNAAQFPKLPYEYSYIQTAGRNVGRPSKRWKDKRSLKRDKPGVACNLLPLLLMMVRKSSEMRQLLGARMRNVLCSFSDTRLYSPGCPLSLADVTPCICRYAVTCRYMASHNKLISTKLTTFYGNFTTVIQEFITSPVRRQRDMLPIAV